MVSLLAIVILGLALSVSLIYTASLTETTSVPKTTPSIKKVVKPVSSEAHTSTTVVTIYFDNFGFDPNEATVPLGSTVSFDNISTSGPLNVEAVGWYGNPVANSPLNVGTIDEGQSKTITLSQSGVWQYQGDLNPSIRGEIGTGPLSVQPQMDPNAKITTKTLSMVYDIYGFMPNEVTVPVGTTITLSNITNNSQPGASTFEEEPGQTPANPALDVGTLQKQQSASFFLTTPGSWTLEDIDQPLAKALSQITAQ